MCLSNQILSALVALEEVLKINGVPKAKAVVSTVSVSRPALQVRVSFILGVKQYSRSIVLNNTQSFEFACSQLAKDCTRYYRNLAVS